MKPAMLQRIEVIDQSGHRGLFTGTLGLIAELILRGSYPACGWQVRIILVGDREITTLKRQHFNLNRTTDVISFNITGIESGFLEGEIYICVDAALRQSREYQVTLEEELQRLAAHGVHHLLGQEDGTRAEKAEMTRLEEAALTRLKAYLA